MVKISKSPLPQGVIIKSEQDYRSGIVFDTIVEDCRHKCYICEAKEPIPVQIEHRIAHRNDPALKFAWDNLYLSCGHCNGIKSYRYKVLDPSRLDPEEFIELELKIDENLLEEVVVKKLKDGEDVDTTRELLDRVYNGGYGSTKEQETAACHLKNLVINDLKNMKSIVDNYKKASTASSTQKACLDLIAEEVSLNSAFAAFKRKIVRDDPELPKEFYE